MSWGVRISFPDVLVLYGNDIVFDPRMREIELANAHTFGSFSLLPEQRQVRMDNFEIFATVLQTLLTW